MGDWAVKYAVQEVENAVDKLRYEQLRTAAIMKEMLAEMRKNNILMSNVLKELQKANTPKKPKELT